MNTMGENPSAIKYMTSIRRTTLFGPINHVYTGFPNALFKQLNGEREKSIKKKKKPLSPLKKTCT